LATRSHARQARVVCMRSRERGRPRPLCERSIVMPVRGLVPKGSVRISLLQDTLLRARTPALPTHRSPFHREHMISAHLCGIICGRGGICVSFHDLHFPLSSRPSCLPKTEHGSRCRHFHSADPRTGYPFTIRNGKPELVCIAEGTAVIITSATGHQYRRV